MPDAGEEYVEERWLERSGRYRVLPERMEEFMALQERLHEIYRDTASEWQADPGTHSWICSKRSRTS